MQGLGEPEPKFLSTSAFKNRLGKEFSLSRKALNKFLKNNVEQPIVQEPDEERLSTRGSSVNVWELTRRMYKSPTRTRESTLSSLVLDKKVSIFGQPTGIKDFPLTEESIKKYNEKEAIEQKVEKLGTINMLKKKLEGLRRHGMELKSQRNKQFCHHTDKVVEFEKKKLEYLLKLSEEHNLDLEILIRNGDLIYNNHILGMKKLRKKQAKYLAEQAEIYEKYLREENLRVREMNLMKRQPSQKSISEKKTEPEIIFEEEEEEVNTPSDEPVTKAVRISPSASPPKETRPTKSNAYRKRKKSSKRITRMTKKLLKGIKRQRSELKSITESNKPMEDYEPPVLKSEIQPTITEMMDKLGYIREQLEHSWREEKKEPELADNILLVVKPACVEFEEFMPFDYYERWFNVYNPTHETIDCGIFRIITDPITELEGMLEVWPDLVVRLWPGNQQDFTVCFTPDIWEGIEDSMDAVIWLWSRVIKSKELYRIAVPVKCFKYKRKIKVTNSPIEFTGIPYWAENVVYTKYLEITNDNSIDFDVFINIEEKPPVEDYAEEQSVMGTKFVTSLKHKITVTSPKCARVLVEKPTDKIKSRSSTLTVKSLQAEEKTKSRTSTTSLKSLQAPDKTKSRTSTTSLKSRRPLQRGELVVNLGKEGILRTTKDCLKAVDGVLGALLDGVESPFKVYLTFGLTLGAFDTVLIPIDFYPQLVGHSSSFQDSLIVSYQGGFPEVEFEKITLTATLEDIPVLISPDVVDMQVIMVGFGVWQTSFEVLNRSDKFFTIRIKLPKSVSKHYQTLPKVFTLRPYKKEQILLRARIGWEIYKDASDFLEKSVCLLEFPISVQPDGLPEVPVESLAVISHPLALSLEPSVINFGFVSTSDTAVEEFWLKNHTVLPLHFAFINIPKWGMIMPNYGIFTIGPAQKIKLQFLYSPTAREAGTRGHQAVHTFSIACTTMERLSAAPSNMIPNQEEQVLKNSRSCAKVNKEQLSTLNRFLNAPIEDYLSVMSKKGPQFEKDEVDLESLSFLQENLTGITFEEKKENISDLNLKKQLGTASSTYSKLKVSTPDEVKKSKQKTKPEISKSALTLNAIPSEIITQEDIEEESEFDLMPDPIEATPEENPKPYITLKCRAIVIDPICELTSQKIVLPDVPYGSFSVHSIYLRCPNETSGPSCHCGRYVGVLDDPISNFKANFEFFSSESFLDIQPVTGQLSFGEKVKIYFILKPYFNLRETKSELNIKLLKKSSSRKLRTKNRSATSVLPIKRGSARKSLCDSTIRKKLILIKNNAAVPFYTRVKCLLETKLLTEHSEPRYEILFCDVYSRFTRPDIVVLTVNKKPEIIFQNTAVGMMNWEPIEVHNTSGMIVNVTRSLLGHRGIFNCSPLQAIPSNHSGFNGICLEPEQYLRLKISFKPLSDGKVEEYFEFRANHTVIPLKLTGKGVIPEYTFNYTFAFCKMESNPGKKVEEAIIITNKCDAVLEFKVINCYKMETYSPEALNVFVKNKSASEKSSSKKKTSTNTKSSSKGSNKEQTVNQNIINYLNQNFTESKQPSPITVEPNVIIIYPNKKGTIKINFLPRKIKSSREQESDQSPVRLKSQMTPVGNAGTELRKGRHSSQKTARLKVSKADNSHRKKSGTKSLSPSKYHPKPQGISKDKPLDETGGIRHPTAYAMKVKIMLGNLEAAEWLIIGTVKTFTNKKNV